VAGASFLPHDTEVTASMLAAMQERSTYRNKCRFWFRIA
jgi:hypothetical protein